ncbi:MAG: glutathione S-transferase family protein [Rhodospirillaceae bacterium]|jgi:GSH-dependent disulfide-bond oxidoreductase|nr:glutathione S-transferase family protein [Rhodospirillaceae bacterium]
MIHLYAAPTTNGIRAKVTLDECGVDYELHRVDMKAREHKTAEYLTMNPMGMTPVIVDEDGPGGKKCTVPQSIAILFYLAEKVGKFIPTEPASRAAFWAPMMNATTDIGPTYGAISFIGRMAEPHEPTREAFIGRLHENYQVWDGFLSDRDYCTGDEITICDFALFGIHARTTVLLPQALEGAPNVARWATMMNERPGVQKGQNFDG